MSENKKLTPKIRFKGFTEDWEQRKFGDELETITDYVAAGSFADLAANVKYLSNPSYAQLVRTVDIKNNFTSKDNVYVDKNAFNYLWRVNLKDECIIMPNIGNCGEIYLINREKLKYKNNVLGPNAILVRSRKNDNKFLSFDFQTKEFQDRLKLIISPNGQTKFNKTELKTIDLIIPNKEEQLKIGKIFSQIDNLITLHQRKYDKLVKIKSSLLEKMFPKNSSKIPEVRFKGFTEDWEQRKVAEIGDNFSTGTLGYADLCDDGKYKCVLYGDLYTKFNERILNVKSRTNKEGTKVEINDLLFPTSTTVDSISLIAPSCVNQENIRVGGDLFGIRPYRNIDGNFVSYCINNFMPVKYSFAKQAQGLTIVHLQYNAIKNEELMIPTLDEQKKMSQLFVNIDNLITLHQRKLDKLQNIKKSLLDKMFV